MIPSSREISALFEIQRPDNSWVDLSNYLARAEVELGDVSSVGTGSSGVDGRVRTLRFDLKRGEDSFSPADKTSKWNQINGNYAPLLWPNRRVRLSVIIDNVQTILFEGLLGDGITATGSCECRDLAKKLQDCYIEERRVYGSEDGTPAESVIQAILDDNNTGVTLYCPVSPGFIVLPYELDYQSVWDAMQQVVNQFGWFLGYRLIDGGFKLVLMEPPREKNTVDMLLDYRDDFYIQDLEINDADVRNVVMVTYRDSETGQRETITVKDQNSIDLFGRRAMQIEEADTSMIDTIVEAERFAQAALSDLQDLPSVSKIDMPILPQMDVFLGLGIYNKLVSSTTNFYAVHSVRHTLDFISGRFRTEVVAGGKVIGGHAIWLRKETRPGAKDPIETGEIAPGAVDTDRIGDRQVTGMKIEDLSITSAKIADTAITSAKIADAAIDTAKIKDAAITEAKIGDLSADKIKAGTLIVTDQAGAGASRISIKSGTTEKVRLDKDGIVVNGGDIVVKSPTGATMISGAGINVNEFTQNVLRGFNVVRNPFWIDRYLKINQAEIVKMPNENGFELPSFLADYAEMDSIENKIYFVGGQYSYDNCFEYDTITNTWTKKANFPYQRNSHSVVAVNGKIYVHGGASGFNSDCHEYNPATNTWTRKASAPYSRYGHVGVGINGKMYIFGGDRSTQELVDCWEYNPSTNTWAEKSSAPKALYSSPTAVAWNNEMYVMADYYNRIGMAFNPAQNSWRMLNPLPQDCGSYPRLFVLENRLFALGTNDFAKMFEYNPQEDSWVEFEYGGSFVKAHLLCSVANKSYFVKKDNSINRVTLNSSKDSNGYIAPWWEVDIGSNTGARVYYERSDVKGAGQVRFDVLGYLYDPLILKQYLDIRNFTDVEPYAVTVYYKTLDTNVEFGVKIGSTSYSKILDKDFDSETIFFPNGFGTEGAFVYLKRPSGSYGSSFIIYGIQIEKGKISTGIVAPHISDIGIPIGSIQPEHLATGDGLDAFIGVPLPWYDTEPPAWAFPADGRYLNPNSFPKLFERYGYRFGYQYQTVDGVSVKFFRIPDLRGEFIRGLDLGRGVDVGRTLGSWQEDELKEHRHGAQTYTGSGGTGGRFSSSYVANRNSYIYTDLFGGTETRPRNVAFMYIIPFMSIPLGGGTEVNLGTIDVLVNYSPKYTSPWFAVSKAQTYTRPHPLGAHPSNVRVQFSPIANPGPNDKIVNFAGLEFGSYNATIAFDATNVYIYFGGDRVYDGPDGNTSGANPPFGSLQSGYARILAWE